MWDDKWRGKTIGAALDEAAQRYGDIREENVAAADVESILLKHDVVKQAVAVGIADDRLVEAVAVFVELKTGKQTTEQEIVDYCRQHLSSFKVPRRVKFIDEWPMTGAGKIQRFVLKESLAQGVMPE